MMMMMMKLLAGHIMISSIHKPNHFKCKRFIYIKKKQNLKRNHLVDNLKLNRLLH